MKDRTTRPPMPHAATELPSARPTRAAGRGASRATTAGTRRLAERDDGRRIEFRRDFPRRLTVSALGVGTYLGDCTDADDADYGRTVREAVARGVNLIDTASNYRCQRSERVVGRTLESLIAGGETRRDELVV